MPTIRAWPTISASGARSLKSSSSPGSMVRSRLPLARSQAPTSGLVVMATQGRTPCSEPVQAVRGPFGAEQGVGHGGRVRVVGTDVSGPHERARGGAAEVDRAQVADVQGQ